jgi:hypothetical protein
MMGMRASLAALVLMAVVTPAGAVDLRFDGYADFRAIVPSNQESWLDGGLGKLRYGSENNKPDLRFAEAVGQVAAQITPSLLALAAGRVEPEQRTFFDVLEAYIRYRPVSITPFRWSVRVGAFFPPVSLENTDIGWTSPWTLTPSAINSWVGEELRIIGGEALLEWRSPQRRLAVTTAILGWNDPAGVLIAHRGWALDDRPTGLFDRPQEPDVIAYQRGLPEPLRTYEVLEIDGRPGWYANASWDETGIGHVDLIHYDNEANPSAVKLDTIAWRTDFWDLGLSSQLGNVTLLAQGMTGETLIRPSAFFYSDTTFRSAYLLAGWTINADWRAAARFDVFLTDEDRPGAGVNESEHGNAITAAINYLPSDWLRLTAEAVRIGSTRAQRNLDALSPRAIETQLQFSARLYIP